VDFGAPFVIDRVNHPGLAVPRLALPLRHIVCVLAVVLPKRTNIAIAQCSPGILKIAFVLRDALTVG
jgi:hypothetical protein